MERLLFAAVWGIAVAGVGIRALRKEPAALLRALPSGLMWEDVPQSRALPASAHWLLWLVHFGGLIYLWRLTGRSYQEATALGLASAALLILPQVPALFGKGPLDATQLSALFVPEAAAALRALRLLPASVGREFLPWLALGAAAYSVLVQAQRRWGTVRKAPSPAALLLLAMTIAWAIAEYLGGHTHGVTGSDPYCYAQMAVDLAQHGDPRHAFTLFPLLRDLAIPWWPVAHVGYYPPDAITGLAPTVWPAGWPALLAGGYLLLGEAGLYVMAPLAGLAVLAATAVLTLETWPRGRGESRWLGLALVLAILATSREQVLQLLVPMADVPTQLFTVLAMWLALRAGREGSTTLAALAGAALGMAYDMRHTQVLLAPVLALALLAGARPSSRWRLVLAAGATCLIVALPDLWYHRVAFGSPWHPESPELGLIGLQHWWGNARRMAAALTSREEFGLLLPALLYGLWRLWRDNRRAATTLAAWVLVGAGTHFLYGPLRWRDLLSVVPALALLSSFGAVQLVLQVRDAGRRGGRAAGAVALGLALLLAVRTGTVLGWPLQRGEMIFGFVTASQRQAFAALGEAVEDRAVIGTALNSGSVELYTGRETFRPGDWSERELGVFLVAMTEARRPVYILDDGNEHAAVVRRLGQEGRLEPVGVFAVPLYGDPRELSGQLYRVEP